ncbi:MAG: class I SAM-dependent methyltransferase [Chloroflexi bacterium]|nr:class I SAM-dependent methyltransferase [Chloroflexota bacterium]MBI3930976.1 class I SAM-dependent methyltransferase [Chloroflexota bacterium]
MGTGSAEFARNGASVTSADFSQTAVETTRSLLKEANLAANVLQADATALLFKKDTFDCVYSFGVLHHIPDIGKALSEIKRVLKPGGQLMVMLYNQDSLLYGYSIVYLRGIREGLLKKLTMDELLARYSERKEDNPYIKVYTKSEAQALFSTYFESCSVIDVPDRYELGWHLIIKGRKPRIKYGAG